MKVVWAPQAGSQYLFMLSPIFETLYEGTRGPGKTDALIMDFAQHCNKGYGENWRGVLFRQSYPQLADVVARTKKWFYQMFPGARFNAAEYVWTWPTGEQLLLRHMRVEDDYWNYHGHEYPWIGWEELTNWATSACYESMKSCSRSSQPGMPRKYRGTCNPYGAGHSWLKLYFVDPAPAGTVIREPGKYERVRIHGSVYENKRLLTADPDYIQKLESITDPNKRKAWLEGSWDITSGGMFDDLWDEATHVLPPFDIPLSWRIDRSFDWGSSKPFSVGWWAESDGTEAVMANGTTRSFPRGTLIRIGEWYGWNGRPNEGLKMSDSGIAEGIVLRQTQMGIHLRVKPGPADGSIFDEVNGDSPAKIQERHKVRWVKADKSPGSRKRGWAILRTRLEAATLPRMENPGMFVFNTCRQFLRTFPMLPRSDKDPDDVNTEVEDHIGDDVRYRALANRSGAMTLIMGSATNG